ncbi:MAG: glycosyltransferase family 2 protein [Bdellovibrionales bacterium]
MNSTLSQLTLDKNRIRSAGGKFPYSISMLTWAYNEEENIEEFLNKAKIFMDNLSLEYEHILIDDASTDKTLQLAEKMAASYPQLRIHRNEKNMNSGWNTRVAIQLATKDVLFWQTADWAYDISNLKKYLWSFADYDVIQGVRAINRGHSGLRRSLPLLGDVEVYRRSDNLRKAIISVTNYLLIRILFRMPALDFQNVTLYPRSLAQAIRCESFTSFTNPELLLNAYWMGCSILQVPIDFMPRKKGEAKGTHLPAVLASIRQVFFFWAKWILLGRRQYKGRGQLHLPQTNQLNALADTRNLPVAPHLDAEGPR